MPGRGDDQAARRVGVERGQNAHAVDRAGGRDGARGEPAADGAPRRSGRRRRGSSEGDPFRRAPRVMAQTVTPCSGAASAMAGRSAAPVSIARST